ncbi:MAG TPA: GNAT family N-acetyltransferase [Oscillatoriaceae cyanobacterium M33_DOE_052]|uniref:GNAT family N-acetyltransferase n=1 Tax=Planktothricoides sp. SpSt-374 TaxID=2282167 RepID=A0A7C3ZY40_9CYAN|nr:GNAT family N-acetyltransferase [Oscillatoriaceae cyanobacterium M33_DOE_052]
MNQLSLIRIRAAQLKDLHGIADVLTDSFHSREGWEGWMRPVFRLGIYEDMRTRLREAKPTYGLGTSYAKGASNVYYACLVSVLRRSVAVSDLSEETVVGTVEIGVRSLELWTPGSSPHIYLSNLAVAPAYRRQGVASQLLIACEEIARQWGAHDLYLHVLQNNRSARRLYFNLGYRLHRVEPSLIDWFLHRPKRLLLRKPIPPTPP